LSELAFGSEKALVARREESPCEKRTFSLHVTDPTTLLNNAYQGGPFYYWGNRLGKIDNKTTKSKLWYIIGK